MTIDGLGRLVTDLVPHWIATDARIANAEMTLDGTAWPYFELRGSSPDLQKFKTAVEQESARWAKWLNDDLLPSIPSAIQEALAIMWLKVIAPEVNWPKVLAHATSLSSRTFENAAIVANLVISSGFGSVDISDPKLMKLTATLGGSMQSFMRVDGDLRLMAFENIPWSDIRDTAAYKLYPEFLHPVNSILELDDVSVHHTGRGDLLIMKRDGLRAARRKGQWRIYEPAKLRDVIADVIKNYQVGSNLFELLLDLSFRRRGALLIYDPFHVTLENVVNKMCVFTTGSASGDAFRVLIAGAVSDISMGQCNGLTKRKRLLMELASLDGAVIFDENGILAVGAMIATHREAGNHAGARTTAAVSALKYGAFPIKVSSDGDIELFFPSDNRWGIVEPNFMSFL